MIANFLLEALRKVKNNFRVMLVRYALFSTLRKFFVLNKLWDSKFKFYYGISPKLANKGSGQEFSVTVYPDQIYEVLFNSKNNKDVLISKSQTLIKFIKGRALSNAELTYQTLMSEQDSEWEALKNPEDKYAAKQYVTKSFELHLERQRKIKLLKTKIEQHIDSSLKLKLISRLVGL